MGKCVALILFFACVKLTLTTTEYDLELEELEKNNARLEAKETLNFGDTCSWADEEKRIAAKNKSLEELQNLNSSAGFFDIAKEYFSQVNSIGSMCKTMNGLHLRCLETGTCGCEDAKFLTPNITSIREDGECRLKKGATCTPSPPESPAPSCVSGTTCQIQSNQTPCQFNNIIRDLVQTGQIKVDDSVSIYRIVYKELVSGICQCL